MTQQSKRRKKRYEPGSAYAGDVKPAGIFSIFANVKLFFIVGAFIMVGGLAVGGICGSNLTNGNNGSGASNDFVKPDDSAGTGTPEAKPTITIRQYNTAPALTIDPSKKYVATIKTAEGDIQIELLAGDVPQTVNNFVFLAKDGFYNGLIFHQVASGFDAQAGDPSCMAKQSDALCRGSGGAGYDLPQEKPGDFQAGDIGMANSSQFFLALDVSPQFSQYTPFGKITSGLDVAKKIAQGTAITSIEISEQ